MKKQKAERCPLPVGCTPYRPSLRLLRDIRRAAPQAAFSANWRDTFLLFGIIGFAGGVIFAAVLLLKGL